MTKVCTNIQKWIKYVSELVVRNVRDSICTVLMVTTVSRDRGTPKGYVGPYLKRGRLH